MVHVCIKKKKKSKRLKSLFSFEQSEFETKCRAQILIDVNRQTNERSVDSRPKLLYFPSAIHSSGSGSNSSNEEDNANREKMIPRNHCA